MTRVLNAATVLLCAVAAAELWAGLRFATRAGADRPLTALDQFRATIDGRYHDCVPLGWYPERVPSGRYYPRVNLDVARRDGPFQSLWVAIVRPGAQRDPRVAAVKRGMDELVTAGLLVRGDDIRGERYNLTTYGQRFFYDNDAWNDNAENWPYLCYSRLSVTSVAWDRSYADVPGPARSVTKRVRVSWQPEVTGAWASPFLRAHSVQLRPTTNPARAIVRHYIDDEWMLLSFADD